MLTVKQSPTQLTDDYNRQNPAAFLCLPTDSYQYLTKAELRNELEDVAKNKEQLRQEFLNAMESNIQLKKLYCEATLKLLPLEEQQLNYLRSIESN